MTLSVCRHCVYAFSAMFGCFALPRTLKDILMPLSAFGLNCTLSASPKPSSTQKMLDLLLKALGRHGVDTSCERVVDHDVKPGVKTDEGKGDAWPALRKQVLDADILVFATPIWMGQPSSVAKRVTERMDAFLGEIDKQGRYPTFGRVAIVGVVGNEDGAHHVTAEIFQALNDVGFTLAAAAGTYWVGEAMNKTDYLDVGPRPDTTGAATRSAAANAAHLARLLRSAPYEKS